MKKNIIGYAFLLVLPFFLLGCLDKKEENMQILRTLEERQVEKVQPSEAFDTEDPVKVDF